MLSDCILVINSGSSSLKSALFEDGQNTPLFKAEASALASAESHSVHSSPEDGKLKWYFQGETGSLPLEQPDHAGALKTLLNLLNKLELADAMVGIGHRVVHGGQHFHETQRLDAAVMEKIRSCNELAPLHNPANLNGIELTQSLLPELPQWAVFDTAFHNSLPPYAFHYAVPGRWYDEYQIRRFGFHGINHQYIAQTVTPLLQQSGRPARVVSAHLGNGCSICAIRDGKSVDTSMGFTPLEGLMMGTRSGDIDAGLLDYLCRKENRSISDITRILNKESGLKGVSGLSNDMRTLLQAADSGHEKSQLAINLFCYRLAKSIASYVVSLGTLEALVFTGGIGEHAAPIRAQVIRHLQGLGFELDQQKNLNAGSADANGGICNIASKTSPPAYIIPANEEWMIAHLCRQKQDNVSKGSRP